MVDQNREFYFLEMNTRLQVEHPVTEMVTGLDLVEWQIRVADGEALPLKQNDIRFSGHAIEVRLCAEDPRANFMPQTGCVELWRPSPHTNVRIDAGIREGQAVTPFYDSMLAKVIAHAENRDDAISALRRGLTTTRLLGVHHNKHFLHTILGRPRFIEGAATTAFLAEEFETHEYQNQSICLESVAMAASLFFYRSAHAHPYPHATWSSAEAMEHLMVLQFEGGTLDGQSQVKIRIAQVQTNCFKVTLNKAVVKVEIESSATMDFAAIKVDGKRHTISHMFTENGTLLLDDDEAHIAVIDESYSPATMAAGGGATEVRAAMDGALVDVKVTVGDQVKKGQVVAILEAMKMAHQLKADVDGTVEALMASEGQQVKTRQVIVKITPLAASS